MIQLQNIGKYYYSPTGVGLGLKKINLSFKSGEFVVITGESGSGKTTLLNVISGMDTFEEGEMYLHGEPLSAMDDEFWEEYRRNDISFIYQDYKLIDSYTVLENVEGALLMQGYEKKAARKQALEYLKQVGIYERRTNRAAQLSSGQKQRLAIARALAKNSQIIIADEPTGNLDVENGRLVMQLLAEIAKTRLVIVVTHNYEQAEDFATRLIRLYRGQVSDDIRLRERAVIPATGAGAEHNAALEENETKKAVRGKKRKGKRDAAGAFLKMNLLRQPIRNGFFFLLCICLSLAFLVFLGIIAQNLDGAQAMEYNEKAYFNGDDTRILIRNVDGSELTEEDFAAISQLKYIEETERYADISDVNYYYRYGEDYEFTYKTQEAGTVPDYKTLNCLENSAYMKSATCINEDDLTAGELPDGIYEMVIVAKDKSLIGTKINVVCCDRNNWQGSTYYQGEMTVTGIVSGNEEQFYFSEAFCDMLTVYTQMLQPEKIVTNKGGDYEIQDEPKNTLITGYDPESSVETPSRGVMAESELVTDCLTSMQEQMIQGTLEWWNELEKSYFDSATPDGCATNEEMLLVIDESLEGTQIILPADFYDQHICILSAGQKTLMWQAAVPYNAIFSMWNGEEKIYYELEIKHEETIVSTDDAEDVMITAEESTSGRYTMNVSQEFFDTIYPERKTVQGAVYIKDYAYTDRVIKQLTDMGYEAISVFRLGAVAYDVEIVYERLTSVCVAAGALLALFVLGVMLLALLMKTKQRDDTILHLLGMKYNVSRKINVLYFTVMLAGSGVFSVILMHVLKAAEVKQVVDLEKYFLWPQYVVFVLILGVLAVLLSKRYMRLWRKSMENK